MGTSQMSDIFHGVQFTVDFAASSQLSFKDKQQIRREIVDNGGILSYILTKQVGNIRSVIYHLKTYLTYVHKGFWSLGVLFLNRLNNWTK